MRSRPSPRRIDPTTSRPVAANNSRSWPAPHPTSSTGRRLPVACARRARTASSPLPRRRTGRAGVPAARDRENRRPREPDRPPSPSGTQAAAPRSRLPRGTPRRGRQSRRRQSRRPSTQIVGFPRGLRTVAAMRGTPAAHDFRGWVNRLAIAHCRQQAKRHLLLSGPSAVPAVRRGCGTPSPSSGARARASSITSPTRSRLPTSLPRSTTRTPACARCAPHVGV